MLAGGGEKCHEISVIRRGCGLVLGTAAGSAGACAAGALGPDVQPFVHIPGGQIAIQHLRIIDGTGAAPIEDATLLIDGAKIGAVLPAGSAVPAGYRTLDGTGETAMPGLVGMHNHLLLSAAPEPRCRRAISSSRSSSRK